MSHQPQSEIFAELKGKALYAINKIPTVTEVDQTAKQAELQGLQDAFLKSHKSSGKPGTITLTGDQWPASKLYRANMQEALQLAQKEIVRAVLKANAAIATGDKDAIKMMTTWFGDAGADKKNWKIVRSNLKVIEYFLLTNISFEYKPDKTYFAATLGGKQNMEILIGPALFDPESKVMKPEDSRNVAFTIIHEASHNVCRTHDHLVGGKQCYGEALAKKMAAEVPWKAWDTAACYQFFCGNLGK